MKTLTRVLDALYSVGPSVVVYITLTWITWQIWVFIRPRNQHTLRSVAILVLGDIGRSPRMMYHAQSFAENNFMTNLIGYGGSKPIPALERLPKLQLHYLPEPPRVVKALPFIPAAPIKVTHQIVSILFVLVWLIKVPPEFILVQNPPSIPTLLIVQFVAKIRGCKVIIDWHNLGYTILALKIGTKHPLVRIAKWFERTFGHSAYAHLFVTAAMKDYLTKEWDLQGKKFVLHDRPPHHFHRASPQETHELFQRLHTSCLAQQPSLRDFLPSSSPPYSTPFTQIAPELPPTPLPFKPLVGQGERTYYELHAPKLRPDRPALLISSTSWTADEDFSILIRALELYEMSARNKNKPEGNPLLPKVLVIVTGKGPLREQYMREIEQLQRKWEFVRCVSLWLEAEDYPLLLGSADLGISLHSSSSALDLPMKVVDMFGCGLPVCALDFACLHELMKDKVNGLIFRDAEQLASQLEDLLTSFPSSLSLAKLASAFQAPSSTRSTPSYEGGDNDDRGNAMWEWGTWEENWGRVMRPLILSDMNL